MHLLRSLVPDYKRGDLIDRRWCKVWENAYQWQLSSTTMPLNNSGEGLGVAAFIIS